MLVLGGTADGIYDARKLRQETVASVLYDAAPMLSDLRIDQLPTMGSEPSCRAFLPHSPRARISRHIGGENRGETADRRHCSPGESGSEPERLRNWRRP